MPLSYVYTDESESDDEAGFGVVFSDFCLGARLPSVASIIPFDLSAILHALKVTFTFPQQSFAICCDSRTALQALDSFKSTRYLLLVNLVWLVLMGCCGRRINFCWVPANVGVVGNKQADDLAKVVASTVRPSAQYHPDL